MKKTAMITGATSGIGRATAGRLAKAGYDLIITGRREERLDKLAHELSGEYGTKVQPLGFDVRDQSAVKTALEGLNAHWQTIDVLVNNAGLASGKAPIDEGDPEDWDVMIDTNVKGLLYVTRYAMPFLKSATQGQIVNIGSNAGREVYPAGNVYCASKHAVDAITRSTRLDLLPHGIRVIQIRPGLVETEFSQVRFRGDTGRAKKVYQGYTPLTPQDVADAVHYCISVPAHVNINDLEITPFDQANANYIKKEADEK